MINKKTNSTFATTSKPSKQQVTKTASLMQLASVNWPTLVGSTKQTIWAETIRYKWLVIGRLGYNSTAPTAIPSNKLDSAFRIMTAETKAAQWIKLQLEFNNPILYILRKLQHDPQYGIELTNEERHHIAMMKFTPLPVMKKEFIIRLLCATSTDAEHQTVEEEWLATLELLGSYDVDYQNQYQGTVDATFTFTNEDDAVKFNNRWGY